MMGTCALCKEGKDLKVSHIIPSFVGKWLKETSATGMLRGVTEPDKRLQDLRKIPLLCNDCEQKLSAVEAYFASEMFRPFLIDSKRDFKYDSRLTKFIISLSWRCLLVSYDECLIDMPNFKTQIDEAERIWREYLLGKSTDPGPYEHHMIFLDYIEKGEGVPDGFQWYSLRAVDATLVGNNERVLAYSKFPWMIFASSIHPLNLYGWKNTKIEITGEVKTPQTLEDGDFGSFLLNRPKLFFESKTKSSSGTIDKRIIKTIQKNPEKYLSSQSLEISLAEAQRRRDKKKKGLPDKVNELIRIIEEANEDPTHTKPQKQQQKDLRRILANSIADVSIDDATSLDVKIDYAIRKARVTGEDSIVKYETDHFIMSFMVNQYYDKEQQRSRVYSELDRLKGKMKKDDKRHLMVFSWNPYEVDLPYESAFYVNP